MGATFGEVFASRPEPPPSRAGIAFVGALIAATLVFTLFVAVSAGSNSGGAGSDLGTPTVLDYPDAHESFTLRVRVKKPDGLSGLLISDRYSIAFYDARSRELWRANDERGRVYPVGSDVARIVITREGRSGPVTYWKRS